MPELWEERARWAGVIKSDGESVVRRAYKFPLAPTTGQSGRLVACLEDHRLLYNAALEERRVAWRRCRVGIRYRDQSAQLKNIRSEVPCQARWSFSSQQATLRRLDKAFGAFFRRLKLSGKAGYPRFKSRDRFTSVEWPKDGDGCRWRPKENRVYLQGVGHVKVRPHRPVEGVVKTVVVRREGRRWYVVLSCDDVPPKPLPETGRKVGVDLGVARFLTTSDGEVEPNPRFLRSSEAELAKAQQALARTRQGSANQRRARARVAEVHRRVAHRRNDFHHKVARRLVKTCDALAFEKLAVGNMTRSASGTVEEPGTNVAAKGGLNRSILDVAWSRFLNIITAKAEEAGRRVVFVDPWGTSIICHQCGTRCTRPEQAVVICPRCAPCDADLNGARNVASRAGLGSGRAAPAA